MAAGVLRASTGKAAESGSGWVWDMAKQVGVGTVMVLWWFWQWVCGMCGCLMLQQDSALGLVSFCLPLGCADK